VVAGSSLPPNETFATLFALESMALLRFDPTPRRKEQATNVRDDLKVKQLSIHKASYFEVLNVHWSSYDAVIDEAYEDSVERFDVEAYEQYLDEETLRWSREIKDRLDTAYRVLSDRESRHRYRKKIMPDYKIEHGIPALLKRADLAEARGHWEQAVDALRRVLELKPEREDLPDRLKRIAQKKAVQAAE
jgi:tetratricopeptide (TPR) repeat protein